MANPEHVEILKQGVEVWNKWRRGNSDQVPDLSRVEVHGLYLGRANFEGADLSNAYFIKANLAGASLSGASLDSAVLEGAELIAADLSGANLRAAYFNATDLTGANLERAYLYETRLAGAVLQRANLREARLVEADLHDVNLKGALLCGADLWGANLTRAELSGADLSRAAFGDTVFGGTNLKGAVGIETCRHQYPSILDIHTIARSEDLPVSFLRGCGLPDLLIEYIPSLLSKPIQFYSCFISYSSKDHEFAERLHTDLQAKGVRVWFAPHDLAIGAKIRLAIDESIRVHDKLLLVLSEHSVSSQWVEQEVETALAREREPNGKTVLFPVRIDDAVMESKAGWPALLKNTRNVGDFTRWKEHDSYRKAFDRLLRDLKAEA